jgi:hypothetical protein
MTIVISAYHSWIKRQLRESNKSGIPPVLYPDHNKGIGR